KMAERAYQFECDDDTSFIAPDNWQFDRAGLLAGERLALQLQEMERSYLLRNTLRFEVEQWFPITLVDPGALLDLRETGTCEFLLPEILFNIAYPGYFARFIESVRLTIPCVVGPHTNVSANLTLTQSWVRKVPTTDSTDLWSLPVQTPSSVVTSTAD